MPRVSKQNRQSALSPEDAERAAIELYEKEESRKVRKRPDSAANVSPDANRQYIALGAELMQLAPTNMDNPEEVRERIFQYFGLCADNGIKPSVAGLALAFGKNRQRMCEYMNGKRQIAKDSLEWIEKAYAFLNMQLECWMNDNKINAVAGIFQAKANFGYQDTQRLEITTAADTDATPDELARKYADSLPTFSEEYEQLPDFNGIPTDF